MMLALQWAAAGVVRSVQKRLAEWAVTAMMLSSGLALTHDPALLSRGDYGRMLHFYQQDQWAGAFLILGSIRLFILILNGATAPRAHARAFLSFLSGFVWLQVAIAYASAPAWGLGIALIPWLGIMDFIAMLRGAEEARSSHQKIIG